MSWKPEVEVDGKWSTNGLRFETEKEATESARELYQRWLLCTNFRATESNDPVNYSFDLDTYQNVRLKLT